ncbi:MAG: tetratricopeptide repeat protein, partial [Candidatus Acidiferrales bacterium]
MRLFWWRYAALAVLGLGLIASARMPESRPVEEAIRLNNLGVAYMNQQRFAQALEQFEQAYEVDPELHTARLNQGIALLNQQRYDAARAALLAAGKQEPGNVRVWYNLGLLHKNLGETEVALEAFQRVAQLDARDADTQYFLGLLRSQLQRYEPAIAAFQAALALNPFHVSAEFGLARAYQRLGDSAQARQHLARFQHLTQENLGAPMSLIYGEQGQHSRAEQVARALGAVAAAIRVRFVPAA